MAIINKAAGILIKDRKILVERSFGKDVFVSPGGRIEDGETEAQALVRELREEFQIKVEENDLEKFGQFTADAAGGSGNQVAMTVFIVKQWKGQPTPDNEVEEIAWINSSIPDGMKVGSIFEHEVIPRLKSANLID